VLFYIFLSYPSASSPMHHGPPSQVMSRASRLSATHPRLGFRLPPKNSCLGRPLPPCLKPPHPGALALRPAYRVVDHRSILLVSFCQDVWANSTYPRSIEKFERGSCRLRPRYETEVGHRQTQTLFPTQAISSCSRASRAKSTAHMLVHEKGSPQPVVYIGEF
jgi:hypothetical protein